MFNASFRRRTLLLLLVAGLATPWASAAGPLSDSAGVAPAGELLRLDFLGRLWSLLQSAWSKEGCRIDPNGICVPNATQPPPPPVQHKEGCRIDPSGQCLPTRAQPANQTDTGCRIDPNGSCLSGLVRPKEGCRIDPDGLCHS
jgi:hypothetical protein